MPQIQHSRAVGTQLQSRIDGEVLRNGEPGYDDARVIFNAMIDRRPGLIVQCASDQDVLACVDAAQAADLPLAVRAGGHNVAGSALCDGGLVIDLRRLRRVVVDTASRTARVQAGATWRDYDRETQRHGVATPGGIVSTTGVGGLTLGGGIGVLRGLHGLSCDNLLSATMVTAEGELLVASETEHAELFWALRGGGGNFGVVLEFEFRVHPVSDVCAGTMAFPLSRARELIDAYRGFMSWAPPELNCDLGFKRRPDGRDVVVLIPTYFGTAAVAERVLAPFVALGPAENNMRALTYAEAQQIHDKNWPAGERHYWKSTFLSAVDDETVDTIAEWFGRCPSPIGAAALEHFHGRVLEIAADATAFSHRSAPFNFLIESHWLDAADDDVNVEWTRGFWNALQRNSTGGVYVNYLGEEPSARVREAYGAENYARLETIKRRYDPRNVFSSNQNIVVG